MVQNRLKLTRNQLGAFLDDFESIRQFEQLFAVADQVAPSTVDDSSSASGSALAIAQSALDEIESMSASVDMIATDPRIETENLYVSAPITGSGGYYDPLAIPRASAISSGYLDASDFSAFSAKADDTAVVHNTGNETVGGVKTFSDGIILGAETLSIYDEGVWTPDIRGSVTAGTNTYTLQNGTYTRIGRLVVAKFRVIMSAKDAAMAGNALIGGLPFTSDATSGTVSSGALGLVSNVTLSAGKIFLGLRLPPNNTSANISEAQSGAAYNELPVSGISNTTDIVGNLIYFV